MTHLGQNLSADLLARFQTLQGHVQDHLALGDPCSSLLHVFCCFPSQLSLKDKVCSSQLVAFHEKPERHHPVQVLSQDLGQWKIMRKDLIERIKRPHEAFDSELFQLAFVCPTFAIMSDIVPVSAKVAGVQVFLEVPCDVALEEVPIALLHKLPSPLLHRVSHVVLLPAVPFHTPNGHHYNIRLASILSVLRWSLSGGFASMESSSQP
mgnify:CR=1 FL=1